MRRLDILGFLVVSMAGGFGAGNIVGGILGLIVASRMLPAVAVQSRVPEQ